MLVATVSPSHADDPAWNLPIGDAARRDKQAEVVLDGITDTAKGDVVTPRELALRLKDVRIVFVGESHTSIEFHNAQRRLIEELHRAGRRVLIGLEMYPYTEQKWLDQWNTPELGEDAFLKDSRWYQNWGYHWNYYRGIFLFAKTQKIRMFAINTPRAVVTAVRRKGFSNLTPEEAAHIPSRIDTDHADHRRLFKSYFTAEDSMHTAGMTEEQWDGMYRAQATWDATMGFNAVQAFKQIADPNAIMVVLIGSGHVAYGLGAERQAALWFDGKMASVIPVPAANDKGEKPLVRASYANFIWGVAPETYALFPSLGLSFGEQKPGEAFKIIDVQKDSVAERAGFRVGDLVSSMDGVALQDKESFNRAMSQKRWGDSATFAAKRAEESLTLTALFRRDIPRAK